MLGRYGSSATVASNGGRFVGFVAGSALPAALAADWLMSAWNQNGAMELASSTSARLETIIIEWIRDLLRLPAESNGAFVTGATMGNFAGLAAARHVVSGAGGLEPPERGDEWLSPEQPLPWATRFTSPH